MQNNQAPTSPYISLQTLEVSVNELTIRQTQTGALNKLRIKEMELLKILCQNYPEVTLRKELADTIWAGTYASDFTINQTVNGLRSKLFDLGKAYIVTVPKRGYKLTVEPEYHETEPSSSVVHQAPVEEQSASSDPMPSQHPGSMSPAPEAANSNLDNTIEGTGKTLSQLSQSPSNTGQKVENDRNSLSHLKSVRFYLSALCASLVIVAMLHWFLPTDTAYSMGDTTVLFIPDDSEIEVLERLVEQNNYQYIDKVKETLYGCDENLVCSKIKQ
ncbi:winged helix-turn-helix domain-containing protein [Photobacterium sp. BZF1]|uniref:winged helix-turn-helix domain-containing protein n=1 Tax=Photobacterium sp. BZF1 TaxID=1904457 RepID=UPI001653DE3E|nr:winged helix-turn-helix domain-containing protein [Photobacterium sp. BZF1]MBC7006677.1 winged helix-turn-helix domain-containing protein [Photobacterium sp. BZF1]